jgi:hypothetical protein
VPRDDTALSFVTAGTQPVIVSADVALGADIGAALAVNKTASSRYLTFELPSATGTIGDGPICCRLQAWLRRGSIAYTSRIRPFIFDRSQTGSKFWTSRDILL